MYRFVCAVLAACALVGQLYGQEAQEKQANLVVGAGIGLAREQLHWSIAGDAQGQNPPVLSELAWGGLYGAKTWMDVECRIGDGWVCAANFSHMAIFNGQARDTDYGGDNRTATLFDMRFGSNRGHTLSYGGLVGYRLHWNRFSWVPYVGYRRHTQHLLLLDGGALESTYHTKWEGPEIRLSVSYRYPTILYGCTISYAQLRYGAIADWNLVDTFAHPVSFTHKAKGFAVCFTGSLLLFPHAKVSPLAFVQYGVMRTGTGIDELYLADGGRRFTQLNGVRGNSMALGVGLTCRW